MPRTTTPTPITLPPKIPFGDTALRDEIVGALFGPVPDLDSDDAAAFAHLTGKTWAGAQTERAVEEIDEALREIISYAAAALESLHADHRLPGMMIDGFSRFDSALRTLPKAENRLLAVVQTSTNAHHHAAKTGGQ